jgi:acyl-coenzyme A synthetase/AMP-(fatty) acid ligase
LEVVKAKYLIAHVETLDRALAAAKIHGLPESNILIFGDTGAPDCIRCVDGTLLDGEELGTPIEYTKEEIMNDPAFLYFTSGTTGRKKAVMVTQYAICSSVHMKDWPYHNVNILSYTEFHHASALLTTMHLPIYFGSTSFIMAHYSLRNFCAAVQNHQIHMTTTQPYVISALANNEITKEYDISSLKGVVCGGAALDNSITRLAKEKLGLPVLNVYAMTECLGGFDTTPAITLANGTGHLAYGFSAKLVDEEGNEVPEGEMGELWLKGPTSAGGYYRNPEATADTFDSEGYVHTGDLFKRDQDGLFTYVDRSKDLIKYLLHHIYPSEIEKIIMTHSAVVDCAVIGVYSSEFATELPRAYVQLVEGEAEKKDMKRELLEYAHSQLSDAKHLRGGIVFIDSFPRTPSGKIQRRFLRDTVRTDSKVIA